MSIRKHRTKKQYLYYFGQLSRHLVNYIEREVIFIGES